MNEIREEEMIPVSLNDTVHFGCHPGVSCFNACCHDVSQFLYPYDILRLKTRLKMDAASFLDRHCLIHEGPETGLPIVSFKLDASRDWACPFVGETGCSVYEDRPASCRMYPLARGLVRDRATGAITEHFALIREPHCMGFGSTGERTVAQWLESQEVALYNEMNDKMMEIISLKNRALPGPLQPKEKQIFVTGCYDLDGFRESVLATDALRAIFPEDRLEKAAKDDTLLLALALDWVRHSLFGSVA